MDFHDVFINSGGWWLPWMTLVFKWQVIICNVCNILIDLFYSWRYPCKLFEATVFPSRKQNFPEVCCSLILSIAKNWQMEKHCKTKMYHVAVGLYLILLVGWLIPEGCIGWLLVVSRSLNYNGLVLQRTFGYSLMSQISSCIYCRLPM